MTFFTILIAIVSATSAFASNDSNLLEAVKNNETKLVEQLLADGANPNTVDEDRFDAPVINYAASNNNLEMVKILVDAGADVNLGNEFKWQAIHAATRVKNVEIVSYLLDQGADVDAKNFHSGDLRTPLLIAINNYDVEMIDFLLDKDANVDLGYRRYPLHISAQMKQVDTLKKLLRRGANVNVVNYRDQFTPIFSAAEHDCGACIKELIKYGADPNAYLTKEDDVLPIHTAASWGKNDAIQALIDGGSEVNKSPFGSKRSPLIFIAMDNNDVALDLLLQSGANPVHRSTNGRSALSYFAEHGNKTAVEKLIKNMANPCEVDSKEKSPQIYAEEAGHSNVAEYLKNQSCQDWSEKNKRLFNGILGCYHTVEWEGSPVKNPEEGISRIEFSHWDNDKDGNPIPAINVTWFVGKGGGSFGKDYHGKTLPITQDAYSTDEGLELNFWGWPYRSDGNKGWHSIQKSLWRYNKKNQLKFSYMETTDFYTHWGSSVLLERTACPE